MRFLPEDVRGAATASVSTLTVLVDWTSIGSRYHMLLFYLINKDVTNSADFIIQTSEDGVHPDTNAPTITVPAGSQGSLEVGPTQLRKYWRLLAQTASPVFPTVSVTYGIRGCDRLV